MEIIDCSAIFGTWPSLPVDVSVDCLLRLMDSAEITKAMTCSTTGIFYNAAKGNHETLDICEKHERLLPAAVINPRDSLHGGDISELKRRGFYMLRLYPDIQKWPANYHPLEKIFKECAAHNFAIMVRLPSAGFASALTPFLDKYPVRLILSGGNYPSSFLSEALSIASQYRSVFIETRILATTQTYKLFSEFSCDRVCFGTGMPLYYPQSQRLMIEQFDVSDECRRKIYSGTIKHIAGIE